MNKHELFASANSSCRARRQEQFRFGLNREATLQGLSRIGVWMFLVSSLYVLWGADRAVSIHEVQQSRRGGLL